MSRMRMAGALMLLALSASAETSSAPDWAYPTAQEKPPFPSLPAEEQFRVEGSALVFTGAQLNEMQDSVDWLPDDHPPAPPIVAHGDPAKKVEACANCHGMSGGGSLEVPSLAGLPKAYITEQLHEFAKGGRRAALKSAHSPMMAAIAAKMSESDIEAVSGYFASVPPRHHVQVVETAEAPRTTDNFYGWQDLAPEGGTQPLGKRIVEVGKTFNQLWIGDPHAEVIAYVPPGAIARGETLVRQAAQPCISCHGATLRGIGAAPPLAGRDPHYLARALWDIKSGARGGPTVALMQKPVKDLTPDQIADIVAYLASLAP